MGRRRYKPAARVQPGCRIRAKQNMRWSGVEVPMGTVGTVYVPGDRPRVRAVHWDGFPLLQPNGFPFGIGGTPDQDFVPYWAEVLP